MVRVKSKKKRNREKVLILLSSYNGEKYISQQLDSLLAQTYPVDILIRDDGSTDGTVGIIESYMKSNDNIKLIVGKNIGFWKSFNVLLCNKIVDEYEFVAFSDQDDYWMPKKIESAIKMIQTDYESDVPALYLSNMNITNEHLKTYGYRNRKPLKLGKYTAFVNCSGAGCTMLFNHSATWLYKQGVEDQMPYHDYQMLCVCLFMGKCYYDHNSYILYRQHGNNAIGEVKPKTIHGWLADAFDDIKKPKQRCNKVIWFDSFLTHYSKYLSYKDRIIIERFVEHENSFLKRASLILDPRIISSSRGLIGLLTTVSFKGRMLINRMEYYPDCK